MFNSPVEAIEAKDASDIPIFFKLIESSNLEND